MSKPEATKPLLNEQDLRVIEGSLAVASKILSKSFFEAPHPDEDRFRKVFTILTGEFGKDTNPERFDKKQRLILQTLMQVFEICSDTKFKKFLNEQNLTNIFFNIIEITNEEPEILKEPYNIEVLIGILKAGAVEPFSSAAEKGNSEELSKLKFLLSTNLVQQRLQLFRGFERNFDREYETLSKKPAGKRSAKIGSDAGTFFKVAVKKAEIEDEFLEAIKAASFDAISFTASNKEFVIQIRVDLELTRDLELLEKIIGEHKAKDSAAAEAAAEVSAELLLEPSKETSEKRRKKASGKKPKKDPEAAERPLVEDPLRLDIEKACANLTDFLDEEIKNLRIKLNISEGPEALYTIWHSDHPTKSLGVTLTNISREPTIKMLPSNFNLNFDEESRSLKIKIDASKFPSFEESSNQLKGFIRSQILRSKDPLFPTPKPTGTKAKASRLALDAREITPPPAAGADGLAFDKKILRCINERGASIDFNLSLVEAFPEELKTLIRNLTTSESVKETHIYGSFVYGQNPKDLDLQVVLSDGFFTSEDDTDGKSLKSLLPPELAKISKIERKSKDEAPPPPIWRIDIGNLLQITAIERKQHEANQNWTSSRDAKIVVLKTNEAGTLEPSISYQPRFLKIHGDSKGSDLFHINEKAKNFHLRVIYSTPNKMDEALIARLASILTNKLLTQPRVVDTLRNLIEGASEFEAKHSDVEQKRIFRDNVCQVFKKLTKGIFPQSGIEFDEAIKNYELMPYSTTSTPATSPSPRAGAASAIASTEAGHGRL